MKFPVEIKHADVDVNLYKFEGVSRNISSFFSIEPKRYINTVNRSTSNSIVRSISNKMKKIRTIWSSSMQAVMHVIDL